MRPDDDAGRLCLGAAGRTGRGRIARLGRVRAGNFRSRRNADHRRTPRTRPDGAFGLVLASVVGHGGFNSFAAGDPAAAPPPLERLGLHATPVVVELFTSQGCSSCPPADAMLAGLADAPDILPLSFHVDYWDYLGWADSFARPEFTARQERYAHAAGERSVYTPQIIVDGQDTAVSLGPAQLTALIDASRLSPAMVSVQRDTTPGAR
ncbi:DUF1223 domain-containing protein [Paracoccus aerius]